MQNQKRAMFIGRWQPFHKGHEWLINQKLKQGIPVLIAIRDVEPDSNNPMSCSDVYNILTEAYGHKILDGDVNIIIIPDIESVNYGRGVGYEINEFVPPDSIKVISATKIRQSIRDKNEGWKEYVPQRMIKPLYDYFLKEDGD